MIPLIDYHFFEKAQQKKNSRKTLQFEIKIEINKILTKFLNAYNRVLKRREKIKIKKKKIIITFTMVIRNR